MKKIYKKEGIELPEFSDIADQDRGKQHKATPTGRESSWYPLTGGRGEVIQPFGANKRAYGALGSCTATTDLITECPAERL